MEINGKVLAVEDEGEGDLLIMVHGLGGTSNSWHAQAATLARFFRVLRPDLEGSGRSKLSGSLSIPGFASDIVALMDVCGMERAHLIGHSMGTLVCQHVAAKRAERVMSLALLGPIIALPEAMRQATRERASAVRQDGMRPIADTLLQVALSASSRHSQPALAAFLRESVMRQDPEGYARTCEALAAADGVELESIGCPVLVMSGEEDRVAPPAVVRELARRLPRATTRLLSGCAHWAQLERPQTVNDALLEHLLLA